MALIASRGIGNAGTMEIHDDGSTVTMRIRSSDGSTYSGGIPISRYVNGGWSGWFNIAYPSGSPWVNVWSGGIGSSQSVAFRVGDTGTWGFGGGGELWGTVARGPSASKPSTPAAPTASNVQPDRMTLNWTIPANGGAAIDQMLLRRSLDPTFPPGYVDYPNSGSTTSREVTGLTAGVTYYWRVYAHNAVGYSSPSPSIAVSTFAGGRVRVAGIWKAAAAWMRVLGVWKRVAAWQKVAGAWKRVR